MGLYNFMPRFVPKIRSGEKRHMIRGERAHPDKPGDTMHLYCGLRTKSVELIFRAPCVKVEKIEMRLSPAIIDPPTGEIWNLVCVFIEGERLSSDECESLARRDGFWNFGEMMEFWDGRLPFRGHVYHWRFPA